MQFLFIVKPSCLDCLSFAYFCILSNPKHEIFSEPEMTDKTIPINPKFKNVLLEIKDNTFNRHELISTAEHLLKLTNIQAKRFVSRNVHVLTSRKLLVAIGSKSNRGYRITPELSRILNVEDSKQSNNIMFLDKTKPENLLAEEVKVNAELKLLLGEIDAYQDFLQRFPEQKDVIHSLLFVTRDEAAEYYGRLNAIRKIINKTQSNGTKSC